MSFVTAPEFVSSAAGDLAGIGSALGAATAAAATPTTGVAAAAADEVSAAISKFFSSFGQEFQAANAQASAFHAEFVKLLNGGTTSYLSAEVANAQQNLIGQLSGGAAGVSSFAAAATAEPLIPGLPIPGLPTGGTGGGLGGLLGGSGGLLDPLLFGGTGGLLGPLVGGSGLLTSLVGNGPLGPFFNSAGQQFGQAVVALISGNGAAWLQNTIAGGLSSVPGLQALLPWLFPPTGGTPAPAYVPGEAWLRLFSNTGTNLSALGSDWASDPFPFLRQILTNQQGYAVQFANDTAAAIQNIPYGFAHSSEILQAGLQNFAAFDPGLAVQQYVNHWANNFQIIGSSLSASGQGLQTGMAGFPEDMQPALQAFGEGKYNLAVNETTKALLNVFITGFGTSDLNDIRLLGPVADLFPILAIPGQEAQGLSNTLPTGSIHAKMADNLADALNAVTNTKVSTVIGGNLDLVNPLNSSLTLGANFGLPLQVLFGVGGAPIAALDGLATGATIVSTGFATGNPTMVVGGLFDTPAFVLDGLLNGETIVDLTLPVSFNVPLIGDIIGPLNVPVIIHLPFNGLLVPPHPIQATVPAELLGIGVPLTLTLGGTQFSGLLPQLINTVPRALADSITD